MDGVHRENDLAGTVHAEEPLGLLGVFDHHRADEHPVHPGLERPAGVFKCPHTAAELDGNIHRLHHPLHALGIHKTPFAHAVKVGDVERLRILDAPEPGHLHRVVRIAELPDALRCPDAATGAYFHSRDYENHAV